MHALSRTEERQTIPTPEPTGRAFTLTPNGNAEVVEMAIERMAISFKANEKPIVVRFERLLRKIFRLRLELAEVRTKNLVALGRKEAS